MKDRIKDNPRAKLYCKDLPLQGCNTLFEAGLMINNHQSSSGILFEVNKLLVC